MQPISPDKIRLKQIEAFLKLSLSKYTNQYKSHVMLQLQGLAITSGMFWISSFQPSVILALLGGRQTERCVVLLQSSTGNMRRRAETFRKSTRNNMFRLWFDDSTCVKSWALNFSCFSCFSLPMLNNAYQCEPAPSAKDPRCTAVADLHCRRSTKIHSTTKHMQRSCATLRLGLIDLIGNFMLISLSWDCKREQHSHSSFGDISIFAWVLAEKPCLHFVVVQTPAWPNVS